MIESESLNVGIPMDSCSAVLGKGTEEELLCIGYRYCRWKAVVFYIFVALSLGILYLITYWQPHWRVRLTSKICNLSYADTVILQDENSNKYIEPVIIHDLSNKLNHFTKYSSFDNANNKDRKSTDGNCEYVYVEREKLDNLNADDLSVLTIRKRCLLRYFDHRHVRYVWHDDLHSFDKLCGLESGVECQDLCSKYNGLTETERSSKLQLHGENNITVEVKSYVRLFFEEILNPFYIFQIVSVSLWYADNYYIFATCIVVISAISLSVELFETRKQRVTLRNMVTTSESSVSILQPGGREYSEVATGRLVPGDVIVLAAKGCVMTCDAVLISGNAIVDEGMLTGESVPVTKTPLVPSAANETYSPDEHKRHTLFCGTRVIQTRFYGDSKVKAVVVRTGFTTAKGGLVRSILYPKQVFFKFYTDALKFVAFLACIAVIGMIYSCSFLTLHKNNIRVIILTSLDIVTIAVPPALPAAMTVGIIYAQSRLKKAGIFCISPQRINLCGKLNCICFDKTGTLTEEGLDLWGVIPTSLDNRSFLPPVLEPNQLPHTSQMAVAMATCHSLTVIDGELNGDPLDLKMFESINWLFEESGQDSKKFDILAPTIVKPILREMYMLDQNADTDLTFEVGIIRQFTFSSGLQRMSVIVRILGADHMDVFAKGAPEKIAALCDPETLPHDYYDILQNYTSQGLRVIAVAAKSLDSKVTWHQAQRLSREVVEADLSFIGLLVMENKLKPESTPVLDQLRDANIRTVMVTGDNILTAISVARHCGMISPSDRLVIVNAFPPENDDPARIVWEHNMEHSKVNDGSSNGMQTQSAATASDTLVNINPPYQFAVSGRSFAVLHQYFPELVSKICLRGIVFARMTPDQKSKLIENLQELKLCVGMCGDGANDCGALRTAHAGISLSEAEASVASPFTSKTTNISCVPTVIREGRAALVTSFGVFKYMALYSIIQYASVIILITHETKLDDAMYLYIDLFIITITALFMGHTGAYPDLVKKRPASSLVSPNILVVIILHILIIIGFQTFVIFFLIGQPWYVKPESKSEDITTKSMDTTAIFYISVFQYLMLAFLFSKGPPYRQQVWKNIPFISSLTILTSLSILLLVYPPKFLQSFFGIVFLPSTNFRLILLGLSFANFLVALLLENVVVDSQSFKKLSRIFCCKRKTEPSVYKVLTNELDYDTDWPPVGEVTWSSEQRSDSTIS